MTKAPTVIVQIVMVLAVCWLSIDQACQFKRDRDKKQREKAKGLDLMVTHGTARRVR